MRCVGRMNHSGRPIFLVKRGVAKAYDLASYYTDSSCCDPEHRLSTNFPCHLNDADVALARHAHFVGVISMA